MNESWRISRRTMLRGVGAAVALPFLEVMRPITTLAAASAKPVNRLLYLYFPNGVAKGAWYPRKVAGNGQLLELNEWMSPLEPFKEDIIIPSNVWTPLGNGHVHGPPTWLTGSDYDRHAARPGGISADQLAGRHAGKETLLPSLELSTKGEGFFSNSLPRNCLSWSDRGAPVAREIEPRAVFDRMFRPPSGGATKRSVMDLVLADAKSLEKYVSRADQRRLDEYFESIRALEKRIEFSEKQTKEIQGDKALTDSLTTPTPGVPSDHQEYVRLMLDMVVLAFWSDATRVSSFMLDHGQSNRYFNFIPKVTGTWHALSHWREASGKTEDDDGVTSWDSVQQKHDMYTEVVRWHHRQVAYLLGRMKQIQEPDGGTLLDNSMIVYGSSLGDGHEHDENDLPTLVAGGGAGAIRTGRFIEFDKPTDLAGIHLYLLQQMGVDIDRFGTCDRPTIELKARTWRG